MRKSIHTILLCFILKLAFGQPPKKITTYLLTQNNLTLYDRTFGNNPWGVGIGLQAFYNAGTKFKPTAELTADIYLADDKVLRLSADSFNAVPYEDVPGMINFFVGSSFYPAKNIYLSFTIGPSIIAGQAFLGIKPSVGVYFSENKKWMAKLSYINVFSREKISKDDFGSLSLAIGLKLF
jgi:hypothetical protein